MTIHDQAPTTRTRPDYARPTLFDPGEYDEYDEVSGDPLVWYQRYLRSPWWRWRRQIFLAAHPACMMDGRTVQLEVHHVRYSNLRNEPDDDLIVLCARCHGRHHGRDQRAA